MVGTHGASEYDGHTARYTTHTYSETKMQMWIVDCKSKRTSVVREGQKRKSSVEIKQQ